MSDDALWIAEWQRCEPWFQATLDFEKSRWDLSHLLRRSFEGSAQFWSGKHAAMVTEITQDQDGPVCEILVLGGAKNRAIVDLQRLLVLVEAFARSQGCVRMRGWGRPGWMRWFPETAGYIVDRARISKTLL